MAACSVYTPACAQRPCLPRIEGPSATIRRTLSTDGARLRAARALLAPALSRMRIHPGQPYPLGATWDGRGVNFALFSEHATRVELCLFDGPDARSESHRIALPEHTDQVWHGYLPHVRPGQLYGYRVHGPYAPGEGHRFNPTKVVLDPYAKAIARQIEWCDEMFAYRIGDPAEDLSYDERDNAAAAPLAAVVDTAFTWGDDRPPRIPWADTVIYETHVRGFTMRHPSVPDHLRGTYAGLVAEAPLAHLQSLGVTAVELMPIHHHAYDRHLVERGLSNYWGYNTLAFFAPHARFAAAGSGIAAVNEFKTMVRSLHAAGIEVILDVVYNHTAEGSHMGPTLSMRGIDNCAYYRLVQDDARYYMDFTGCGNTLNMMHPRVLQLLMDSLRYWVLEMHVDGFRFDLASALARELWDVNKLSAFFDVIHQDPVLSQVKLIAEPWDVGPGGYQVGNFPVLWTEWNGRYRDSVRRFWRGDGGQLSEFATRLVGSSDLYEHSGRRPYASINFVTAHDGFTLHDLVAYNDKHNEANGENNGDGDSNNHSWNSGAEGPTDDPDVLVLRRRRMRNFLATLILSQGVPMLCGGDEIGRTQQGNNNAYCQDNDISWFDWERARGYEDLFEFTRMLIALRREHAVFRRRKFFQGRSIRGAEVKDLTFLEPNGQEMTDQAWDADFVRSLMVLLGGDSLDEMDEDGSRVTDDTFLLLLNAHHGTLTFRLPSPPAGSHWERVFDTADAMMRSVAAPRSGRYRLRTHALALFRTRPGSPRARRSAAEESPRIDGGYESAAAPAPEGDALPLAAPGDDPIAVTESR